MTEPPDRPAGWKRKFACAWRGVAVGIRGQRSFLIHLPAAVAVLVAGWLLGLSRTEVCLLIVAVAAVLAAELFNTAIEELARAIDLKDHPHIRDALDISAAAVLLVALAAALVGVIVLGSRLW